MRFQPTNLPNRSYIGEHWTRYQLRSMQLILQATHGVVSGAPAFFKKAFGDSYSDFNNILLRPHHFIFNRQWYERLGGKSEFDEFASQFCRLTETERDELVALLSSVEPRDIRRLPERTATRRVREILPFYTLPSKAEEARIWELQKTQLALLVPDDERVEDAGLDADDEEFPSSLPVERQAASA